MIRDDDCAGTVGNNFTTRERRVPAHISNPKPPCASLKVPMESRSVASSASTSNLTGSSPGLGFAASLASVALSGAVVGASDLGAAGGAKFRGAVCCGANGLGARGCGAKGRSGCVVTPCP